MKIIDLSLLGGLFLVLALTACGKTDGGGPDSDPDSETGVEINGVTWATRNVAAFGKFAARPEAAGMFYQWNRAKAWPATGNVTGWDSSTPAGDSWDSANDPCPTGWRVPTPDEQLALLDSDNVDDVWTIRNRVSGRRFTDKTSGKSIFLPAAGGRDSNTGRLYFVGTSGDYWSESPYPYSTDDAQIMGFQNDFIGYGSGSRANGLSVRCVNRE